MTKMSKLIKAVIMSAAVAIAVVSLPAVDASAATRRPDDCAVKVSTDTVYSGGKVKVTPTYTGEVTDITYEFYASDWVGYGYGYPYYYKYIDSNPWWSYYYFKSLEDGFLTFVVDAKQLESGVTEEIDIPESVRGKFTVKAVFRNSKGITVAKSEETFIVKNDSRFFRSQFYNNSTAERYIDRWDYRYYPSYRPYYWDGESVAYDRYLYYKSIGDTDRAKYYLMVSQNDPKAEAYYYWLTYADKTLYPTFPF